MLTYFLTVIAIASINPVGKPPTVERPVIVAGFETAEQRDKARASLIESLAGREGAEAGYTAVCLTIVLAGKPV